MKEDTEQERIARLLAGQHTPEDEQHLAGCEQCKSELARMENSLKGFRSSVRSWTARQPGAAEPQSLRFERALRARAVRRMQWSLVTAALAVLIAVPAWRNLQDRREAAADRADSALLERINDHISRPVPLAMEPLQVSFAATEEELQ